MPTNVYGKKNLEWRMCEHRPQTQGKDRSKVQEARGVKDEDAKTNKTENRGRKVPFLVLLDTPKVSTPKNDGPS